MYWVYILTNRWNTTLYIGVTNDIQRRAHEHRQKAVAGFTKKYNLTKLVYVESSQTAMDAIRREKQLKGWTRKRKDVLINELNPDWEDLLNPGDPSLRSG